MTTNGLNAIQNFIAALKVHLSLDTKFRKIECMLMDTGKQGLLFGKYFYRTGKSTACS